MFELYKLNSKGEDEWNNWLCDAGAGEAKWAARDHQEIRSEPFMVPAVPDAIALPKVQKE